LGLGESLRWAGIVRDRVALWRALDVFLLTSDFEGLPMTILEAMAGGCAIIASQVDGVAEILVSGEDALLCPPGDLTAFRSALDQMVNELSLAPKLAAAARAKAVARFSHEKQGKELAGLYEELLDHGKKG
jgi:glycosyltransferase involved in cell wall biosynthesis